MKPIVIATLGAVALVVIAIALALLNRGPSLGVPTAVYYQVVGPRDVTLWVRLLDGLTQPRQLASRPLGSWFVVSPDARLALAVEPADENRRTVEAIELATGAVGWRTNIGDLMEPIWHGSVRMAAYAPGDPGGMLLIDLESGTARQVGWPPGPDPWFQFGFTASGDPVLASAAGGPPGWRFQVVSWADGRPRMATAQEVRDVRPQTPSARRFNGTQALAVDLERGDGREPRLVLRAPDGRRIEDLGLAPQGEWDWAAFDPIRSTVIAAERIDRPDGATEVTVYAWDAEGHRRLLAQEVPSRFDPVLSSTGAALSLSLSLPGGTPLIGVIDLRDGRVVILPLPDRLVEAAIVQVVDGGSIPAVAVAPVPTASQSITLASPSPVSAIDGPSVVAWRIEEVGGGTAQVQATILGPAADGGVVAEAVMPAIDVAVPVADPSDRLVTLHPRPGSDEILVWYGDPRTTRSWSWTPGGEPTALDLPPDLPDRAWNPIWSPDGGALAFQTEAIGGDGASQPAVAVMDYPDLTVQLVPSPAWYSDLAGWAPTGERLVLHHGVCVEGCPGRYAYYAALDLDGTVMPTEVGDTSLGTMATLPIDQLDPPGILLTSIQDETGDDVFIPWPGHLPARDQGYAFASPDGRDTLVLNGDRRELILYRIADPLAAAVDGVAAVPPVRIGAIRTSLSIQQLHPELRWALAADGTRFQWLVDVARGSEHELGVDMMVTWR